MAGPIFGTVVQELMVYDVGVASREECPLSLGKEPTVLGLAEVLETSLCDDIGGDPVIPITREHGWVFDQEGLHCAVRQLHNVFLVSGTRSPGLLDVDKWCTYVF